METAIPKTDSLTESSGKNVWAAWPTIGLGFAVLGALLLSQVLVVRIFRFWFGVYLGPSSSIGSSNGTLDQFIQAISNSGGLLLALATISSALICVPLIILFIHIRKGKPFFDYIGLNPISLKTALISLSIVIGFSVISNVVMYLLGKPIVPLSTVREYATAVWPALLWIAVIIAAPVFEEIFFRGFLFEGLRRSRLGLAGTVILTSLAWALLHTQYDWFGITSIFLMGIVLGTWRYKTGSLWTTLLMHSAANIFVTAEVAFHVDKLLH